MAVPLRGVRVALIVAIAGCALAPGHAEELSLPTHKGEAVVGDVRYTMVWHGDSLLDIARTFDIGYGQIIRANPRLNRWIPRVGAEVVLPSMYILPRGERRGIILNLAELRLYYYPPRGTTVHTFPVSVGDYDWRTPLGKTKVVAKQVDPPWYPPKSIREEHLENGDELPAMIPGGDPDNPLGHFALKLGIPGYLIHGTDQRRSYGIGMRVSHGCIRLYPEDIETLYTLVSVGTPVTIVDQPIKAGWRDDNLYLEVHHPLGEEGEEDFIEPDLHDVITIISPFIEPGVEIDADQVDAALRLGDGIPVAIASRTRHSQD
jgi:L,D-transpeptidase ErfK/SrfK